MFVMILSIIAKAEHQTSKSPKEVQIAVNNSIYLPPFRVKDVAKVTHILTNIPLGSERKMEALAAILVELQRGERQGERRHHPGCMLQIAVAMTYCSVYPHWLVEEVFGDWTQRNFQGLYSH